MENLGLLRGLQLSKRTGEECCHLCGAMMGFPVDLSFDDPKRFKFGAQYIVGQGEFCGACIREMKLHVLPDIPHD